MAVRGPRAIVAIDIGTTQSAVAVTGWRADGKTFHTTIDRWPGLEDNLQMARVPTAVVYDSQGKLAACGGEVAKWISCCSDPLSYTEPVHFKMQLHPSSPSSSPTVPIPPWSDAVPLERIYSDYIRYLFAHTVSYLRDMFAFEFTDAPHQVQIVLTHPNKWTGDEQRFLENVVVRADLLDRRSIERNLHFVEEAEAAASYGMFAHEPLRHLLQLGVKFAVCDAGGSTADISSYTVLMNSPERVVVEELSAPTSLHAGGIHVDMSVLKFLTRELGSVIEDIQEAKDAAFDGLEDFKTFGKRRFASATETLSVKVRERRFSDPSINVKRGMMSIPGPIAADLFKPHLVAIEETLLGLMRQHEIQLVILTGGFAESPYLRNYLEASLEGARIILINSDLSKAVAIGALQLVAGNAPAIRVLRRRRGWATRLYEFGARVRSLSRDRRRGSAA